MLFDQFDIILDVVYSCEYILNGKDFVMEFVCCKKLVDKGIIEKDLMVVLMFSDIKMVSNNGWSEVVKKGSSSVQVVKEEVVVFGFCVVFSKKKGKKQDFFVVDFVDCVDVGVENYFKVLQFKGGMK